MRASLASTLALALVVTTGARADAPRSTREANLHGDTGVLHTTSARTGPGAELMVGVHGYGFFSPDFVVPGEADANTLLAGNTTVSLSLFEIAQLSLAAHAAASANNIAGTSASVGDLAPALKVGYRFLPVAFAAQVRASLPTRTGVAGLDFANTAITAQGIVTLDLAEEMGIPVRAHVNGGYTFELGKQALGGAQEVFEQNPYFLDGPAGHLQATASDQWFYDSAHGSLAVEVPLPYASPFVEVGYRTALGVPDDRGAQGKPYDFVGNAALVITPGVRVTPGFGTAIDLGVDIGPTGNGGGLAVDANNLVEGQPLNPLWLAHFGVSHTFDPLGGPVAGGGGGGRAPAGAVQGCVTDENGTPIANAIVEGPALGGARLAADAKGCFVAPMVAPGEAAFTVSAVGFETATPAPVIVEDQKTAELVVKLKGSGGGGAPGLAHVVGYVTNKDDEVLEADLEVTDARGARAAGKSTPAGFDVEVSPGRAWLSAKLDKYLATGAEITTDPSSKARVTLVLKPIPKKKGVALEKDKIATSARVPFDYKKPRLQSAAEYVLDEIVDVMLRNPSLKVRVEAYAEAVGTPEENQKLADDRAQAVVDYLAQHGVARTRLEMKGVANADEKARRLDFVIVP